MLCESSLNESVPGVKDEDSQQSQVVVKNQYIKKLKNANDNIKIHKVLSSLQLSIRRNELASM